MANPHEPTVGQPGGTRQPVVESAPPIGGLRAGETKKILTDQWERLDEATRRLVERHPFPCLGAALGLGFLIGRLLASRR